MLGTKVDTKGIGPAERKAASVVRPRAMGRGEQRVPQRALRAGGGEAQYEDGEARTGW